MAKALISAMLLLLVLGVAHSSPSPSPSSAGAPKRHHHKREDIAKILSPFPELSRFRRFLIRTQVSTTVNELDRVTVLVADNKALLDGGIGTDVDAKTLKRIISMHVLLNYLDDKALAYAPNQEGLHTLYSTTGRAQAKTGGVTLQHQTDGDGATVWFKSAGNGSDAGVIKSIYQVPGNLSVLQVSGVLIPPNIDPEHPFPAHSPADTESQPLLVIDGHESFSSSAPASAPVPGPVSSAPSSLLGTLASGVVFAAAVAVGSLFVSI